MEPDQGRAGESGPATQTHDKGLFDSHRIKDSSTGIMGIRRSLVSFTRKCAAKLASLFDSPEETRIAVAEPSKPKPNKPRLPSPLPRKASRHTGPNLNSTKRRKTQLSILSEKPSDTAIRIDHPLQPIGKNATWFNVLARKTPTAVVPVSPETMPVTQETIVLGCAEGVLPPGVTLIQRHIDNLPWGTLKSQLSASTGLTNRQMSSIADLMDREWKVLHSFIPSVKSGGRPRKTDMRDVFYKLVQGCTWECVVYTGFPAKSTVQEIFLSMDENRGMGEDAARLGHA